MIREADKEYIVLHHLFISNRENSAAPFMLGQIALIKLLIAIAVFILEYTNVKKTRIALFAKNGKPVLDIM